MSLPDRSSLFHVQALVSKPGPGREKNYPKRPKKNKAERQQNLIASQVALDDEKDLLTNLLRVPAGVSFTTRILPKLIGEAEREGGSIKFSHRVLAALNYVNL